VYKIVDVSSTPPVSPDPYTYYQVGLTGTGDFSGHDGEIAYWNGVEWEFILPVDGDLLYLGDADVWYYQSSDGFKLPLEYKMGAFGFGIEVGGDTPGGVTFTDYAGDLDTPDTNKAAIYFKDVGGELHLHTIDYNGLVTDLNTGGGGGSLATLSDTDNVDYTSGHVLIGDGVDKYVSGELSHTQLGDIGTNTHADIDTHIADTSNPHSVTAAQAGAVALTGDETVAGKKTFSTFPEISSGNPTTANQFATKGYADTIASGFLPRAACRVATAAALAANTYNNGTLGVGATLTGNSNGAIGDIDGVTVTTNDRILVKDEVAQEYNGVYVLTTIGSGGAPYVLTRATDFDQAAELVAGASTFVLEGDTNNLRQFTQLTTGAVTVGTTDLIFDQTNQASAYTFTDGVELTGATVSADYDDVTINLTGTSLQVKAGGISNSHINASAAIDATKIADGSITNTEFQYLNGVTSAIQTQLDARQDEDATLTALAALDSSAGILAQTGADTFAKRTLTGTANQVIISNGTGAAGDPTFTLPQDIATTSSVAFGNITMATGGSLRTGTGNGNTLLLQAYDTDGAYETFMSFTAGSTPSCGLSDSVTKGGGYIYRAGGTDVPVTDGGTGLSAGTSGGIPYYSGTTTMGSSGALTDSVLLVGGGAGNPPTPLAAGLGTSTTILHGNASGEPTWAAVNIVNDTTGTLTAARGGTGQATYVVGDILYASTTTALSRLANVATGNVLRSGGVGVAPAWGKVALTTHVSGILPGANGGTGNGFFAVSGPTTSLKTFTFPNASGTVVVSNTATAFSAQQNFARQALTDGASIAWNLATQQMASVTLAGNRTLANPTNMVNGGKYELIITQDGTGSRTLAYGSAYLFQGGFEPVLSTGAGAKDILSCTSDGTNMYCVMSFAYG
jgi:hypothetical protein